LAGKFSRDPRVFRRPQARHQDVTVARIGASASGSAFDAIAGRLADTQHQAAPRIDVPHITDIGARCDWPSHAASWTPAH
jgi:hypothetical protein